MIVRALANVFDLKLTRPVRAGPSMDESDVPTLIAENLCAIYEPTHQLLQEPNGRAIVILGKFAIDPCDNEGEALDVRQHDHLQFTDYRGKLQRRQMIRRVSPWYCGAELDHILLEIG